MTEEFDQIVSEIRACTICSADLPLGPNPVIQVSQKAKILIASQAPGVRVHKTSIPFSDPSGDRLREWLNIDRDTFYDPDKFAIVPLGFCYPGTGPRGDLPPRPECAPTWRVRLLDMMPEIQLTLIIGQYAHKYHLAEKRKKNLTETVKAWREYAPRLFPLPHPSPRNNIWLKKNPWFNEEVIPALQENVDKYI
jgi:uracil-DNA glycosylase